MRSTRKSCCIFTASIRPITTTVSRATPPPYTTVVHPRARFGLDPYGITIGKGGTHGRNGGPLWSRRVHTVGKVRIVGQRGCWIRMVRSVPKPPTHTYPYPSYLLLLYSVMTASYSRISSGVSTQFGRFNSAQTISRFNQAGHLLSWYSISLNSRVVMNSSVGIICSSRVIGFTITAFILC